MSHSKGYTLSQIVKRLSTYLAKRLLCTHMLNQKLLMPTMCKEVGHEVNLEETLKSNKIDAKSV